MDHQRRRLPHVWAEGKRLFLTWHLYGSLPHALYPPPATKQQNAGQAFVWMDRYLDSARVGPLYLKQQPIAQLVVDSIHYSSGFHPLQARSICNTMTCTHSGM